MKAKIEAPAPPLMRTGAGRSPALADPPQKGLMMPRLQSSHDAAAIRRSFAAEDKLRARLRQIEADRKPHLERFFRAQGVPSLRPEAVRKMVGA